MEKEEINQIAVKVATIILENSEETAYVFTGDEVSKLKYLIDKKETVMSLESKVNDIYSALFEKRIGEQTCLVEDLTEMSKAYKRASWLGGLMLWLVPTTAVLIASWSTVSTWLGVTFTGPAQ